MAGGQRDGPATPSYRPLKPR